MRLFVVICAIICISACSLGTGSRSLLLQQDSIQANEQDVEKLYRLGIKYYVGDSVEIDTARAIDLIQRAANMGHVGAETFLAWSYFRGEGLGKNYDECIKWCTKAAEKGDGEAQILLGECYLNGYGCEKDTLLAIEWYGKAADKGWDEALCVLNDIGVCPYIKAGNDFVKNEKYYLKWGEVDNH